MADIPPREGFLQQRLECPVCLNTFDLTDRVPTALYCLHTFCESCVNTLAKIPPIKCPTCKRSCGVEALRKNFALCDVLEKLCQACHGGEIIAECGHCTKKLCVECLENHAESFQGDVERNEQLLRQEVRKSAELTIDESAIDRERERAVNTISKIQTSIEKYQEKIKYLHEELKKKVSEFKSLNVQSHKQWQKKLAAEVETCKSFLERSEERKAATPTEQNLTKSLAEINTQLLQLLSHLQNTQQSVPRPTDYAFVEAPSEPVVGEITTQPATSNIEPTGICHAESHSASSELESTPEPVTVSRQTPDYTRARSLAVSGRQGSGPNQFARDGYVACTNDRYIVSDRENHRIKVYDVDLKLISIFGQKGVGKDQFNKPSGLCVSPAGELYICDAFNHRVKVYNSNYEFVRMFGSRGCGNNEMDTPMGLAFTPTGELLVTDHNNYRVKVLGTDGSYIRSIGSKGQGPGQFANKPVSVAATPDGRVLVNERDAARLLMFTLSGECVRDITPSVPKAPNAIRIWGFTTDCFGNIIITDQNNDQLIVLDPLGELMCVLGRRGRRLGELWQPLSVAVHNNSIIVYETRNRRIQLFTL